MKSYAICLSLTGLFHLACCSPYPSILLQRAKLSSFFMAEYKCPIVVLSTHLLMDMGCFHILAIINNAAMNIGVLIVFQISVLDCLRYIPRSGIAGSKDRSFFNFLR